MFFSNSKFKKITSVDVTSPLSLFSWKILVVGAGPAGLAYSTTAAKRGHQVTLMEMSGSIGGQFNMAKIIPGKEEFHETLRYFDKMLKKYKVEVKLNTVFDPSLASQYDRVVIATGIIPRLPNIEGINHSKVYNYKVRRTDRFIMFF